MSYCDIIRDLAALYQDGTASESSCTAVRQHLRHCPQCRQYYRICALKETKQRGFGKINIPKQGEIMGNYEALAKRIKRRRMLTTAVCAAYVWVSVAAFSVLLFVRSRNRR